MADMVGYRFHPTDEELVNYFLRNKILGNEWRVGSAINEINICSFDPWDLPRQSNIQSSDQVWYFFCPRDNKYSNSKRTNRTTKAGFWKATGVDRNIRAKMGNRDFIGTKKTLVFYKGRVPNGQRTNWVMHEYHATLIPLDRRTYVVCKVKDKAGERMSVSSCNGSEPNLSLASDSNNRAAINTVFEVNQPIQGTQESFYGLSDYELAVQLSEQEGLSLSELQYPNEFTRNPNPNVQQQTNHLTEDGLEFLNESEFVNDLLVDFDGFSDGRSLYEHCNDFRPSQSLKGVYVNYSSDSDAETISATSHQEISSPVDSVGSLREHNRIHEDNFLSDDILTLDPQDKGSPRAEESSVSTTAYRTQYQPKNINNVAKDHPMRLQSQGKATRVVAPKSKPKEGIEPGRAVELWKKEKSSIQKSEKEWRMAQETNKKASSSNGKGCFIFMETIDTSRKPNPPSVYLLNAIVGVILLVSVIREIVFVH